MKTKNKHKWEWEWTSLGTTSAYCIKCGMHRMQEWKDGRTMYDGKWVGHYFKNFVKEKIAGNCDENITDDELKRIGKLLNNGRGINNS